MVPTPGSTFAVRDSTGPNHDQFYPDEVWLSNNPGQTASLMKDCREDEAFGYYIHVAKRSAKEESKTTHTNPGSRAQAFFNNVTITSSGLEEDSTRSISARSTHLLGELSEIIDAYLADDPQRALLVQHQLLGPKLSNRIVVEMGTTELPFNWQFDRCTLRLTESLLELGQRACGWKEAQERESGQSSTLPLPISDDKILIVSASRARETEDVALPAIEEATTRADADFYVTVGDTIVATMESKPRCSPQNAGDLVRTREDPFRQQETRKLHSGTGTLSLLLQLASQPLAAKRSSRLLIGDWGRLLMPYEVRRSEREPSHARIVFATTASYCDVLDGEAASRAAQSESKAGLDGQDSPSLQLEHLPNAVFFLLGWILQVIERMHDTTARLQEPEAGKETAVAESHDDKPKDPAPPAQRTRAHGKGSNVPAQAPQAPRRSARVLKSGLRANDAVHSGSAPLPLITDYVCTYGPVLGGTYAGIHRCVIKRALLAGQLQGALGPSRDLRGRPADGVLPALGPEDCRTYLKVQRIPSTPDPEAFLPDPRFEDSDQPPVSDDECKGIRERTEQEIRIFEHCKDLQGVTIPRLHGLVDPEDYPRSSAHKLMMEHLYAKPIGSLQETWTDLWGEELEHAVKAAFVQLHARRVYHGDVSSSNVLVEWRKVAVQSGASPTSATTLEAWNLHKMVQEAQKQMQLNDKAFYAAAREVGQHARAKMEDASVLASDSPLSRLRLAVKPHIWLIDFAGSEIVNEGQEGDVLLASEARDVEQALRRWMSKRF